MAHDIEKENQESDQPHGLENRRRGLWVAHRKEETTGMVDLIKGGSESGHAVRD